MNIKHLASRFALYVTLVVVLTGCLGEEELATEENPRGRPAPVSPAAFEQHFEDAGQVFLSDSVLINDVSALDIGPNGQLLVTDETENQVVLFDSTGNYLRILSHEICDPGFPWRPLEARFTSSNSILVVNSGPKGFRFGPHGECKGPTEANFPPPTISAIGNSPYMYGLYIEPRSYHIRKLSPNGAEKLRFGTDDQFATLMYRFRAGGMVADSNFVYVALPFSPYVRKYDASGRDLGRIGSKPSYYRPFEGSITEYEDPHETVSAVAEQIQKNTNTIRLHEISKGQLLLIYRNAYKARRNSEEEIGLSVIDTAGNSLLKGEIQTGRQAWFVTAENGVAYSVASPEAGSGKKTSNPAIQKYRFVRAEEIARAEK